MSRALKHSLGLPQSLQARAPGAACPVVFMSRADNVDTRLNSLAYTLKMLRAKTAGGGA